MVWGRSADLLTKRGVVGSSKVSISLPVRFQQFIAITFAKIVSVLLPIRGWYCPLITLLVCYARKFDFVLISSGQVDTSFGMCGATDLVASFETKVASHIHRRPYFLFQSTHFQTRSWLGSRVWKRPHHRSRVSF